MIKIICTIAETLDIVAKFNHLPLKCMPVQEI
jgi:hypothetical protein